MVLLRSRESYDFEVERTLNGRYLCQAGGPVAVLTKEGLEGVLRSAWERRLKIEEAALLGATVAYRKMKREHHPSTAIVRASIDIGLVQVEVLDYSWIRPPKLRDRIRHQFEAAISEADAW